MNPFSWIAGLFGIGKQYLQNRAEQKQADHEIKLADKKNRARLLLDEETHNSEWEMASLTDKDKILRRFSFAMFALPFIWAIYDAQAVKTYFDVALAAMPEWYIKTFVAIVGGVWGLSSLKNTLPAVLNILRPGK